MDVPQAPATTPPGSVPGRFMASLNRGSLGVALGFAVTAAIAFNPFFKTSFWVLLARCVFVSIVLLLAFVAAQRWPERRLPRWLPRWLLTVLAVGLSAPLATAFIYLLAVGGSLADFHNRQGFISGFFIYTSTALVLGLLIALTAQLREREARAMALTLQLELERSRLDKQASDARLALLTAQVEPHFLFNTLANVQALVESGSARAAPVLQSLIKYLRATLPRLHEREPTLADELALVRAYLELMQMRMPDRLAFAVEVPAELHERPFPAMALLTLVENAVRHGIDPAESGGRIAVGGAARTGALSVWVSDDGVGLAEQAPAGTGLANLRARLAALFGPAAMLQLHEVQPHGLRAEITWPR